jgi:hypothetical protein
VGSNPATPTILTQSGSGHIFVSVATQANRQARQADA